MPNQTKIEKFEIHKLKGGNIHKVRALLEVPTAKGWWPGKTSTEKIWCDFGYGPTIQGIPLLGYYRNGTPYLFNNFEDAKFVVSQAGVEWELVEEINV
jgi:hypothetical protein